MVEVASRELRNETARVLAQVEGGETIVITRRGRPVARLLPLPSQGRRWADRERVLEIIRDHSADPGLRDDLERVAGETTDDLGPIA